MKFKCLRYKIGENVFEPENVVGVKADGLRFALTWVEEETPFDYFVHTIECKTSDVEVEFSDVEKEEADCSQEVGEKCKGGEVGGA